MLCVEKIEGVIWDADGVIWPYLPFVKSLPHYNKAAVRAFNTVAAKARIIHPHSHEEAELLADTSFGKNGLSTHFFTETYGLDVREMHLEFHRETPMDDVISSHPELPELFAQLPHLKHVILTQGSREWGKRCIEARGLGQYFNDAAIIGFEDVNMEKKSLSSNPILKAIETIGIDPSRLVMPEDTVKNLRIPKQHGLQTVFVQENGLEPHWIKLPTPEEEQSFIDLSVKKAADFLKILLPVAA